MILSATRSQVTPFLKKIAIMEHKPLSPGLRGEPNMGGAAILFRPSTSLQTLPDFHSPNLACKESTEQFPNCAH